MAAVAAAFLAGCASTGGPLGLSPAQEKALGEQQHPQVLAAFGGEVDDPQLKRYVEGIFNRLMATDPNLPPMEIYVLDSPVVNAMALPGHVYVTRGLLALGNSEAEIAGVIGHEIGHNEKRHIAKRVSRSNLAQIGAVLTGVLTGDADTAQMVGQGAQLYLLNFSRQQEYESDLVGTRLLGAAGYDPIGAAQFLNTMGRWSNLEARIAGVQRPPEYLTTHPNSANRVARAAQEANAIRQAGGASDERNRSTYLNAIDGLLYGDDPVKNGFIRGRNFIHPQLRFAFTAPNGFDLRNTSQAVLARSASGAQMQFLGASSQNGPEALINQSLSQALKLNFPPAQRISVSGRNAAVSRARANTQNGAVDVTAHAVQWQGASHWVFIWVTPANQTAQLQNAIDQSVRSLRTANPAANTIPAPNRIDVVTAQSGDTVSGLSRYMAFPDYQQERFIILNALDNNQSLQRGERYKLVR